MTVDPNSIDLAQVLTGRLETADPDLLRELLRVFVQALMSADADAECGAAYGTRSSERTNTRNGYRSRGWDTRAGSIELAVPKLRQGSYFPGGCSSGAGGRRRRWSRWWRPATCSGSPRGGWRSWSSSWVSSTSRSPRSR